MRPRAKRSLKEPSCDASFGRDLSVGDMNCKCKKWNLTVIFQPSWCDEDSEQNFFEG